LIGRLSKRFGDKSLAVTGTFILTASLILLPMSFTLWVLLLASTGFAIGNSLVTPTLNAMASRSVSASWQGRVLGVMQSAASLARIIGPVLGGVLLTQQDKSSLAYGRAPFWAAAAIMFIAFVLAMTLRGSSQPAGKGAVTPAEL